MARRLPWLVVMVVPVSAFAQQPGEPAVPQEPETVGETGPSAAVETTEAEVAEAAEVVEAGVPAAEPGVLAAEDRPPPPPPAGEDEGGPVPSVAPEAVTLLRRPPELVSMDAAEFAEGGAESHPCRHGRGEGDCDCPCRGGEGEAGEGWQDLPEDASPCECAARMRGIPEDAPLFEMRRGRFSIAPRGLIQMIAVPWQGDDARIATGAPANEPGFRFDRVRLGVDGGLPLRITYEIMGEYDAQGPRLLDANLRFGLPIVELIAGSAKVPFSGSELTPRAFLSFLDRPWGVDGASDDGRRFGIAPGRMLGVQIGTAWRFLRARAGVFNGNDDYFVGNDNSGLLYAGRVECLPLGDMPDGQLALGDDPLVRIGAAYYFNDDAAGDWHAAEGDVRFRWRGLTIEGEFLWSRYMPDAVPELPPTEAAEVDRWGYYAQAGYLVVDDLLEIAARYDAFLLDDGVDDFNDRWGISGVATLFLLRNRVKVQVEYSHQQETYDPQAANDHVALQLQGRF